jgi:hypothetical protein
VLPMEFILKRDVRSLQLEKLFSETHWNYS